MKLIFAIGTLIALTFADSNFLLFNSVKAQEVITETIPGKVVAAKVTGKSEDKGESTKEAEPEKQTELEKEPTSDNANESGLPIINSNEETAGTNDTKFNLDAQKLLEFIDSLRGYGQQGFSFELSNVSYKQGKLKQRNKLAIQVLNGHSLVEYLMPARQKGRKILKQGQNMWLHLPGTRNVLRITPAQRLLGEASNGDVTGTTFSQDYTATLTGTEQLQQQEVYRLELIAKHRKTAYQKVIFYLKIDDQMPLRSDYYSRSGRLLKQAEYREFKHFDGALKIHKMLLSDPIEKGSYTWMMFDDYQTKDVDPAIFHKDAISR